MNGTVNESVRAVAAQSASELGRRPPQGYDELFRRDGPYIVKMTRRELGSQASPEDVEDAAQHICKRLVERDVLAMYDPAHPSGASWLTFLGRQVIQYCRGLGESQRLHASREPARCDTPVLDGTVRWVELYAPGFLDDYPSLSDDEFTAHLRAYLVSRPAAPKGVSLVALFDIITARVRAGEAITTAVLQAELGVTSAVARNGMAELRRTLRGVVSSPVEVGGVTGVTLADVTAAIEVLETSKSGTAVRQPLARAGNLLAGMDYHAVAKAERKSYPSLAKSGKGTRQQHEGHVKTAVLHRLRRLAAELTVPGSPGPDPEPPVTAEELLENELWHCKDMTPDRVDKIKDLAREAYCNA